ncbi:DUF262 domain-containing protein [Microbacterium sp. 2216-1]|uniref:DUF262 domain-containing protein n=1 Tax=Microbacterium sp. 2216-1 TaxID=3390053 RepID=UPI0039756736
MDANKLTAHEQPLRKVFSSDFAFSIPDYQRPYRWGTEQALQLLEDLEESANRDQDEPYFLGSLVLVQQSERAFDVIDGQQRLTTLTLLFSVLRELSAGPIAHELATLVMEPGSALAGIPARPRLDLRKQDAAFFRKYVQETGRMHELFALTDNLVPSESQRAIRDNAKALYERLRHRETAQLDALSQLASSRTFLVVVTTPDLNSAYRIFSVMNARGLDLAPTDIFKSKVIGSLDEDSDFARQWEDAEESLGSDDFTDLFRDIRTIFSGERARKELLKEFPEQVLDNYVDNARAGEFIDDVLLPYAAAFTRTAAQDFGPGPEWRTVNDWLKRLVRIDNKDWRPSAVWAIKHHSDDPDFLAEFLRRLERVAAISLLRGEYTTPRIARYLEILRDLKAGRGLASPSLELSEHEKTEARVAIEGDVYRMQTRRARYVLLRLDELLAHGAGATYDHSVISIEHVLPQNPASGSHWLDDFDDATREEWVHKLGNLLLLNHRKNSQARNFEFARKKDRYFKGGSGSAVFALTTQVLSYSEWTPEIVATRQRDLTGLLIDEWHLA